MTTVQGATALEKLGITGFIDCDSHVEECEDTWAYLDQKYFHRRPIAVDLSGMPGLSTQDACWLIDGVANPRPWGRRATFGGTPTTSTLAKNKPYSVPSQTLESVETRLKDMDRMKLNLSVLFPTLFLTHVTEDPLYEAALMRSYNSWLADRCNQSNGRLKFAALLPLRAPEAAVKEVRRAKELGAVGLYTMGTAGANLLDHESLDPVWEAAENENLPVTIHVGWSHPGLMDSCHDAYAAFALSFTLPGFMAFFAFTGGGILDRHPGVKVSFLEYGGDWVPYALDRFDRYHFVISSMYNRPVSKLKPSEYVAQGNIYFSVEGDEPGVPETIALIGQDRIMGSADMPHAEARDNHMDEISEREDIDLAVRKKILWDNPLRFYNLQA